MTNSNQCMKSVLIRSFPSPYFPAYGLITYQKIYGTFRVICYTISGTTKEIQISLLYTESASVPRCVSCY